MRCRLALPLFLAVAAPALGEEAPTTIHGKIISVRDRLAPDEARNIVFDTEFTITLSGKHNISEHWSRTALRNDRGTLNISGPSGASNQTLGEKNAKVSWRVLGSHSLQRISMGRQFAFTLSITTDGRSTCNLEAKFVLQKGVDDIVARRFDNGEMAHFSLPRVTAASCTIE